MSLRHVSRHIQQLLTELRPMVAGLPQVPDLDPTIRDGNHCRATVRAPCGTYLFELRARGIKVDGVFLEAGSLSFFNPDTKEAVEGGLLPANWERVRAVILADEERRKERERQQPALVEIAPAVEPEHKVIPTPVPPPWVRDNMHITRLLCEGPTLNETSATRAVRFDCCCALTDLDRREAEPGIIDELPLAIERYHEVQSVADVKRLGPEGLVAVCAECRDFGSPLSIEAATWFAQLCGWTGSEDNKEELQGEPAAKRGRPRKSASAAA